MAKKARTFNEREMKAALEKALKIQQKLHDEQIRKSLDYNDKLFQEMQDLKNVIMDRNCLIRDMAKFIAKAR